MVGKLGSRGVIGPSLTPNIPYEEAPLPIARDGEPAPFEDRRHAGRELSKALAPYGDRDDVIVLAIPRGGVPVAYEVATALHAPLDVLVVRKLGVPGQEELAMGAIASGGLVVLDGGLVRAAGIPESEIARVIDEEQKELERRESVFRDGRAPVAVDGRTVILIDDGLATGSSMQAAVLSLRRRRPARLVVAVPVASQEACAQLRALVDEAVCLETPRSFFAVGLCYRDFAQTTDEEVRALLDSARSVVAH
jgi:predicted phosphoribosyltransferase